MGSCLENCVYKANDEGQRTNMESGHEEIWCAKFGDWMELNGHFCGSFKLRG